MNDPTQVWLRTIGGITEAFYGNFFKFGVAGMCLMLTFELLSFSFMTIYNANLRENIIGEFPSYTPGNTISDLKSNQNKIIYTDLGLNYANTLGMLHNMHLSSFLAISLLI